MPLYDCMLLLKPNVQKEALMDLVARVGKHIYRRNGVLTDLKSFGTVQLGYGIKKLDGRYFQGQLMQMTMMTPPSFNSELHYLNKEDRLLRWLLVKHRDLNFGVDFLNEDDEEDGLSMFRSSTLEEDSSEGEEGEGDSDSDNDNNIVKDKDFVSDDDNDNDDDYEDDNDDDDDGDDDD